jgi:hypothetical protein
VARFVEWNQHTAMAEMTAMTAGARQPVLANVSRGRTQVLGSEQSEVVAISCWIRSGAHVGNRSNPLFLAAQLLMELGFTDGDDADDADLP